MKNSFLLLVFIFLRSTSMAQPSVADEYSNHDFPCEKEGGTVEANLCSATRAAFADSLMNKLYRSILRSIDKEIFLNNAILKTKKNNPADSAQAAFAWKQKEYYTRMKQAIVQSQRQWLKTRELNSRAEAVLCEGGTGCAGIVNEAYIADTLERIKKLESFGTN